MLTIDPYAVEWRFVEGEVMALDVARREYFAVNGSGTVLWTLLAASATEQQLVEELRDTYDLPMEAAAVDVAGFLAQLRDRRLLVGG